MNCNEFSYLSKKEKAREESIRITKKSTFIIYLGKQTTEYGRQYDEWGTGFFFSKDGYALTADHNVRPYKPNRCFTAKYKDTYIKLKVIGSSEKADIAVLQCVEKEKNLAICFLNVIYLNPDIKSDIRKNFWKHKDILIYGYPIRGNEENWHIDGWSIDGSIDSSSPIIDSYESNALIKIERLNMHGTANEELGGISGAPIMDLYTHEVIGVEGSFQPLTGHILGTEIAQIVLKYPCLKKFFLDIHHSEQINEHPHLKDIFLDISSSKQIDRGEVSKWFKALKLLKQSSQISNETYNFVLASVVKNDISESASFEEIEKKLENKQDNLFLPHNSGYTKIAEAQLNTPKEFLVHQVKVAIRLSINEPIIKREVLGINFVLIPPGNYKKKYNNHNICFIAETLISEAEWDKIMEKPSESSLSEFAKVNISLSDVQKFIIKSNQQLKENAYLAIPSLNLLYYIAAAGFIDFPYRRVKKEEQESLKLKTMEPSTIGVYDLIGAVRQICKSNEHNDMQLGYYFGGISKSSNIDNKEILVQVINNSEMKHNEVGFRPILIYKEEIF